MQAANFQNNEQSLLNQYTREIHEISMLSREEERKYAERAFRGDKEARDRLVKANLRFVVSVANKYKTSGLSSLDLINEGNLGLIRAAERFDPSMGYHFISYAVWWIKQSILFAIQQKAHPIRIPLNRSAELRRLKSAEAWLAGQGNEADASIEDLAEIAHVDPDEAHRLLEITKEHLSLDAPIANTENASLMDQLADRLAAPTGSEYFQDKLGAELEKLMEGLTKQERHILDRRFGLDGEKPEPLQSIGNRLGLSKERIRQIEKRALQKLRNKEEASRLRAYLHN